MLLVLSCQPHPTMVSPFISRCSRHELALNFFFEKSFGGALILHFVNMTQTLPLFKASTSLIIISCYANTKPLKRLARSWYCLCNISFHYKIVTVKWHTRISWIGVWGDVGLSPDWSIHCNIIVVYLVTDTYARARARPHTQTRTRNSTRTRKAHINAKSDHALEIKDF